MFDSTYQQLEAEEYLQLDPHKLNNMYMNDTTDNEKFTTFGKRPRTILTTAQRKKFKQVFQVSQKPSRKVVRLL